MNHSKFMKAAIELARRGAGKVSPNPLVGAVIVKNGRIIGKGYYRRFGGPHAEINALENCEDDPGGADIYVNLEPCVHYGMTPPCVDALIRCGIKNVYIGIEDPNPVVSGRGIRRLMDQGIGVKKGILEEECTELNEIYLKYINAKIPFVALKVAQTVDSKIADIKGHSKWISSERSRELVRRLRAKYDSVLVGVNTVIKDDPGLRADPDFGGESKRIVLDSSLRIPRNSRVLNDEPENLIIATLRGGNPSKIEKLKSTGCTVMELERSSNNMIDVEKLLVELGRSGISSIFVEGGSRVFSSFIEKKLLDKIYIFISPLLMGGGVPFIYLNPPYRLENSLILKPFKIRRIDRDIFIEARIQ